MKDGPVRVGIIGSQFQAECHAAAIDMIEGEMTVVAVASPTPGNAKALADRHKIARVYSDYRDLAADPEIEAVTITSPNALHCEMAVTLAQAGKHVICEKPLCVTLDEADRMIEACRANSVLLLYAEELFFTPKYLKAKEMANSGAFGKVHLIKQSEKHFGPHSEWFWDVKRSGGGALLDLGCHGIAFAYWFLGRPKLLSAYSHLGTYVHGDKTQADDEAVTIIEFEGQAFSVIENSWARRGGMDDRIEIYGEGGLTIANLHMGNALPTYSEYGFGYAVEKAPTTTGWTYPVFEELWNYGFPQEMRHFARAIRGLESPQATGEDGKVVLEAVYAAYASAGLGCKVSLPYQPTTARPIDEWLKRKQA
ncbi:Myo-inositol 2-dehydrogenase [Acidisarcina polymorpha]|uniref:Myo-inositol 2-dehydrogenase n=1 Tax=Acidisarcina polymorpha TaxID=2211140 RepID=A0A2Z5G5U0_9BACT|nr:Gfo/Idh/MocA family oxidoreductase [Acidisarcina polymorpha]AXC14147.1 Myo-inositol 2-dehydrogenase [Acidisarcina polymorpha]